MFRSLLVAGLLVAHAPAARASIVLGPWAPTGGQVGAAFGSSVAPAGDVNGDGYSDVIVGAPLFDNGQVDEGRAFLFLGSPSGPAASPAWTWEPNQASAHAGARVAPAGDVNGDGFADLLVCAPLWDQPGHVDAGAVFVFYGSASGPGASPNVTLADDVTGARFGEAAATAGDINDDQFADVIVGAPGFANGQANEGAVYVFHGASTGLSTVAAFTLEGNEVDARAGAAVSTAGDVNADSFADVLVGMPGSSPGGKPSAGVAYVFKGSLSGIVSVPFVTIPGVVDSMEAGGGVSLAGDMDADGYADIMIGYPGDHGAGIHRGAVAFFRGTSSGINPVPILQLSGRGDYSRVGAAVATGGDLDGDGYADVLVGNPLEPNVSGAGSVSLYFGHWTGFQGGPALVGTLGGEHLGTSVATAGDFNGDGRAEVLAGCPDYGVGLAHEGRVLSYIVGVAGPSLTVNSPLIATQPNTYFGNSLAILPYVDGYYFPSVMIGEPTYPDPVPGTGRLLQYYGQMNAIQTPAAHTFTPGADSGLFGYAVADVGDADRDGFSDFVVTSPTYTSGGLSERGRAQLYRGAAPFPILSPWVAEGEQAGEQFGLALGARGDVNGDGYSDVLVGANRWSNGAVNQTGKVWLYLGGPSGLGASTWSAQGTGPNEYFGYAIALSDLDGDGYSDAAISSEPSTFGVWSNVRVYFGGPTGLSAQPGYTIQPSPPIAGFGEALAAVGDFDGDCVGDLVVGASEEGATGGIHLYRGSPGRAMPVGPYRSYVGTGGQQSVGYAIAGGGDLNGDGLGDFVVGAPNTATPEQSEGSLLAFLGRNTNQPLLPDTTFQSDILNQMLGSAIAPLGDVNDDGFADIVASGTAGTGRVYIYLGGGQGTYQPFHQTEAYAGIVRYPPARLDSTTKVGYGRAFRSAAGRDRVSDEFEVLLQNQAFKGIPNWTNFLDYSYDTGPPSTMGSWSQVSSYVYGLWPGATYHWRARSKSRSPYFPRGRWIAPDARPMGDHDFRTGGAIVAASGDPVRGGTRIARVAPNPASAMSVISLALTERAEVRLDVYDVRGRHVRAVARGPFPAGSSSVAWDGADDRGHRVSPGIYFVEFRAGSTTDRSRIVRLP
jgi:hypothetical protein